MEIFFFIKYTRNKLFVSSYFIGKKSLREVAEIRYLGVNIDKKLTFTCHIDKTLNARVY